MKGHYGKNSSCYQKEDGRLSTKSIAEAQPLTEKEMMSDGETFI